MKNMYKKIIIFWIALAFYSPSFAQTDTLCNPNEIKKFFGETFLNYGSVTNGYSTYNRSDFTVGQPLISPTVSQSQKFQVGFGQWISWLLPPQPPTLKCSQGDFKDRIVLIWEVNPLGPVPTSFVIYRDGIYLTELGVDIRQFIDFYTQAGEFYEYNIVAKNTFGQGIGSKAVGFMNPNGVVSGKIETNSSNPVPGVEVRLTPLTGASMAFDGVDDKLCVSYNDKFPTDKFTVSAYVKIASGNNESGIIDWGSTLHKNWWITTTNSSTEGKGYIFHIGNGSGSESLKYIIPNEITNPELPNQWHQITMVYSGSAMSVMVDGNFVGTKPATISRTKNYLNIGGKIGSGSFFKGNIDDVRIYNRPLTQTEVRATKNRAVSKTENGLVAYWKMDEGVGVKVFDNSSVPTNANIYGGAKFSTDIPEVYNAGISDVTGYYVIDGINYSGVESFRATPIKSFDFNSAVEFNAADKSYGNLTNYDIPDTATIEVLFHPFDLKSRQTVLSKGSLFELYVDDSKLYLNLNGNLSDLGVIKAQYYHLAVALDNTHGTAKIYLEGDLAKTVSFTGTSNWAVGNPWLIATNSTNVTGNFYTGLIDEVAIYKTALPQNEIQRHFVVGIPQDSTTAMLYSYFDLNEGNDVKVYDYAAISFGATVPREGVLTKANWSNNVRRSQSKPHEFEPNVRVVNLNKSNTAVGSIDFRDVSTVNVSGTVRFANTFCFADKVEILVNGKSAVPQIITDQNGKWSADFEPGVSIKLSAVYKDHLFSPGFAEFRKIQTPKAGIVFLDNTLRSIKVQVAGGICKKSIIPDRWHYAVVAVKTLDGCFVKTDTIFNPDGKHIFKNLPARAFNVNVVYYGLLDAMAQFNLQGKLSDLRDIPKDSADFIYYAPLQVEASPIASSYSCSTIPILKFLQLSTTKIKVYEEYYGNRCYSNDAQIIIKNGISGLPDSTNHLTRGEFVYKFRPGPVNITPPYTQKLEVRAKIGSREGVLTNPIQAIVLGEKSRGGSTFTSVSNPIIVDILRDPPGDQSYAWREKGTKSCVNYSTSISKNIGDNQGFFASIGPSFILAEGIGITIGKTIEIVATTTETWTKNKNYSNTVSDQVCYTNNEVISTSTADDYVGRNGDLYIGTTTNIVWGLSDLMDWDTLNCAVKITTKLSVDDNKFKSNFIYSTRYIENVLLPELIKLSKLPATNKSDSLAYVDTYRSWRKIIADEDKRKVISYNKASKILTLDAGASFQESTTIDNSSDKTYHYSDEYNFDSASSLGILFGGVGAQFNFGFNYNVTSEGSKTVNNSGTNTYGYFIADNDRDDSHAIGVRYPNSVLPETYNFEYSDASTINSVINGLNNGYNYGITESVFSQMSAHHTLPTVVANDNYKAAIFALYAGSTSCPYEGGRPRERVNFSSDVSQLINVPANTQAVYRLSLGNESPTEETRTYLVKLVNESNPNGAIVKINGQPITATPIPFTVKYGQPQTVTMTLEKGPVKYNYDGIKVAYYSDCEYDAVQAKDDSLFATRDTVGVSYKFYQELSFDTHFIEPCSPINIGFPLQDWVVVPASLNILDITLTEYNKNDANLKQVLVQYRPIGGDGSWTNISIIPKANLKDIFTQYQWNTQLFKDGPYEIRAVAECTNPSLAPGISTVIKGSIERNPPELVGVPQPGDGIWDPGDEISITFNEPINCDKMIPADILGNNTIGLYDATTNALVAATFTCVGNKIVIVPTINPKDFENRAFRVKVSGKDYDDAQIVLNPNYQRGALRDKVGNMIPKSIIWEFNVNQNSLEWVGNDIIETNVVLHPFSVKRQIRNRGGTIMQFRMEDFPFWLTISPSTGTLNPGQTAEIIFTFQQDMLIGDYLANINMVGSQGKEPLNIDYRVRCQPPVWEVKNINEFSGSMNMVVKLNIFGQESMDPSDIIVAKIGDQIRGVGNVSYSRSLKQWLTFMTIYGNDNDAGKNIVFNVWDGSACSEYSEVLEVINYNDGDLVGSPINPQDLHVINLVQKCIPLAKGWNWISINLDLLNNSVTNVLKSLKHKNNNYLIKDDDRFTNYYTQNNLGWQGTLDTLKPQKRYMLYVDQKDTLCIKGKPYVVAQHSIPIVKDWNWIGYVPQTGMTVSQALASLTPLNGDLIKDQTRFAQYVAGNGWVGNLSFLEAPKGYLIKISNAGILSFPKTNSSSSNLQNGTDKEPLVSFSGGNLDAFTSGNILPFDFRKFNSTMNSVAIVKGINIDPNDEIRAYVKGELRGIVPSSIYSVTKESLFFVTLYGNDDEVIEFRLFKADRKKEYTLTGNMTFESDALKGFVENPFELTLQSSNAQISQFSIENQVITQPSTTFNSVSVPASIASNVTCGKFSFNTVLPIGTNNLQPTCTLPTGFQNNMNGTIKVVYNERSNFVSTNDRLIFTDPASKDLVVGCGTSTTVDGQILFNFTVKGGNSSTPIPIDVSYYSYNLKTTFLLKSGISYLKDLVVGNIINPYIVDFSPLKVVMDNNGVITATVTNPGWTGKYTIDVFAMNCSGGNDQQANFYYQRLKTVDCVELTSSNNAPFCAGNTLNLSSSQGGSSYAWAGPNGFSSTERKPILTNASYSARGTYTVTATHSSGCISTSTTTVSIYELPAPTINNVIPICAGTTLNLLGGGSGTYAWAGPNNFVSTLQNPSIASASTSASGVYTLTVTNANLCSSTATTSVIINSTPAIPTPDFPAPVIIGNTVTLTATGCTGTLKWYKTTGDVLLIANTDAPTISTEYYAKCEITANGITCTGLKSANVTVIVLNPSPPVAAGATICSGSSVNLTATGCSGNVGTFLVKWYQSSDDFFVNMPVSPSVPTDYYAKCEQTLDAVTAVSGKSNVVTFAILIPPIPLAVGATTYQGNPISLTATGCTGSGFTLRWFQTLDNALVIIPVSPTATAQYYAKCEQTVNGVACLSAKSNDVTVTVVNRIFVDITKMSASIQNGNSWTTAYGNLQTALAAATANVEVWVAKGTYKPTITTDRTISFSIPSNVIIYGGFAGTENTLNQRIFTTNISILSGDIGTQNVDTDNTYHVVLFNGSSPTTVLNGFTITGGYANFTANRTSFELIASSAPSTTTIETGGGISIHNGGSPTVINCTVINNAAVFGGGLFAGDASIPTITACKFMGNQATFGSGIHLQDGSNAKINNSQLSGNKGIGGIYNNTANPIITNCTLAGNGGYNGGIFNSKSHPVVKNSIIWGNSLPSNDTESLITYSLIQGGHSGIGNLSYDPQFVTLNSDVNSPNINGDYHLKANSLAIDRGDNGTISQTDFDLDGNLRRFAAGRVDIGAYEFQGTAIARLVISIQTGNWESNLTWDIGSIPLLGDYVIIDQNHVITINQTGVAKNIEYRGTGTIKFNSASSKLNIGF